MSLPDETHSDIEKLNQQVKDLEDQVRKLTAGELNQYALQTSLDSKINNQINLVKLSQRVAAKTDLTEIAGLITEELVENFDYEKSILYIWDEHEKKFSMAGFEGYYEETELKNIRNDSIESFGMIELDRKNHIQVETNLAKTVNGMDQCVLIFCRTAKEELLGIVVIGNSEERSAFHRRIDPEDRPVWVTISNIVTSAFENARLHSQLEVERNNLKKTRDDLKTLNEKLEKEVLNRTRELEKSKNEYRKLYLESRRTGDLYRSLLDASPDPIVVYDKNGFPTYINRAFEKVFGWSLKELVGKTIDYVPSESQDETNDMIAKVNRGDRFINQETKRLTKDGRILDMSISAVTFKDTSGNVAGCVIYLRDMTEKKRLEQEILKVSKLESVGLLAGGIAHDFNNTLSGILMSAQLAGIKYKQRKSPDKYIEGIRDAAKKAVNLTTQLLTFAKGGAPVKKTMSINQLIVSWVEFALRGSNVKCEFDLPDNLPLVDVDEGQMSQVIHNLVINAVHSMPEGGTLKLNARKIFIRSRENDIGKLSLAEGDYIMISVKDHGMGIKEEYLSKIFDPYFTTKNNGTGLGLATTFSILRKHKGYITAESLQGKGSTFHIYLPVSSKQGVEKEMDQSDESLARGKGKILVMDDEDVIKEFVVDMINELGYEADLVIEGKEAIEMYKKAMDNGKPYDAVMLDLTIPGGMGGKETMKELLKIDPAVKGIVSSGYSTDPIMSEYENYGFCGVLPKPYEVQKINILLGKIIGKKES